MKSMLALFEERLAEDRELTPKMKDILQTSLELFSSQGYSNTSTKEVAQAADVAEGTIFKHFGSKEKLLYATLIPILKHTIAEEWRDQLSEVTKNIENYSFTEFLTKMLKAELIHSKENLKVFKILYIEYLYQEDLRENLMSLVPTSILMEIDGVLTHYREQGEIINLPNKEIFRLVAGTLITFELTNEMMPITEKQRDAELDHIIEFLLKGLRPN